MVVRLLLREELPTVNHTSRRRRTRRGRWVLLVVILNIAGVVCPLPVWPQAVQLPESQPDDGAAAAPVRTIAAQRSPADDQAIEARLEQIFSQLEGMEGVRVTVRSGVVVLAGEVLSQPTREQAMKLARQVEGVVEVEDNTTLVRDMRRQLAPAIERLRNLLSDVVGYLPLIIVAIVTVAMFWFLALLLGRWDGLYRRFTTNQFLADFARQLTKLGVIAIGFLLAFEILNATALAGTLLGAAGLLGLTLGFALRDTVENYIAGILLSMKQPFVHDDWVDIEGHEGFVLRLTSRATIVMTLDGNHVRIPNARVFNGIVINYTRNPERRFSFDLGVSVETNLASAQQLAARTLVEMDGVIEELPPRVDVHALGDSNVTLRVYGWVDQRHFDFLKVRSEAIRLVKEAFDAAGVEMPEPIYNLRMHAPDGAQTAERATAGPKRAIDISRRTEIEKQSAEDRRASGEVDLLRSDTRLE